MRELVRLRMRPSRDGRSFSYFLDYVDPNGKRQRRSLGHTDPKKAKVERGTFHDLRRTAICNWFREGPSELEAKTLAGHANFETTHKHYLKVDKENSVRRARKASAQAMSRSGTLWHAPLSPAHALEEPMGANAYKSSTYDGVQGQVDVTG